MINKFFNKIYKKKQNRDSDNCFILPVKDENGILIAEMVAVDLCLVQSTEVVHKLSVWREKFKDNFLTQFEITEQRTRKWLEKVVIPKEDSVLFIIKLLDGRLVGNFGVCNIKSDSAELDNTIRGEQGGPGNLISLCEKSLLVWLFEKLEVVNVYLHVFSNNIPAIMLHRIMGFNVVKEYSLVKELSAGEVKFIPVEPDCESANFENFKYLRLEISKDGFYKL